MRARYIYFGLSILIFVSLITLNQKTQNIFLHPENFFRENEKEGRTDSPEEYYKDYLKRRVSPVTGVIPPNAMQNAIKILDERKKNSRSAGNTIQWTEYGPNNIGGRTRAILIDDANPTTMWAGSVGGGLFISTNSGDTWQPVNDMQVNLAVCSITRDKITGNIYYGTGEGYYNTDAIRGDGIFKSTDGGVTFSQLSSTESNSDFYYVNDMDVDPNVADRIYAATNTGFFVSNNGGSTWTKNFNGRVFEIAVNKVSGTDYIATSRVYRSYSGNSGTFVAVSPTGVSGSRVGVTISPQDTNYIYASFVSSGDINQVVKSTDGGVNWTNIGDGTDIYCNTQCWYDHYIAVSPWNKNTVFVGAVSLYRNTGTPGSWADVGGLHSDQHTMTFHPANPSIVYAGCDGGVYKSTNGGSSWTEKNTNYNVTQFYAGSLGANNDVVGGTQDNGTPASSGMNPSFNNIWWGDGFFTAISRNNTSAYFYEAQFGALTRSNNKGATPSDIYDSNIDANNDGEPDEGAPFSTVFELDEVNDNFYLATSGGLWHASGAINFSTTPTWKKIANRSSISAIATAKDASNLNTIFFGNSSGGLYRINDAPNVSPGQEVSIKGNLVSTNYVSCIAVDPTNAAHLLVTFSTFSGNHIYETYNALTAFPSWTLRDGNLPDIPVNWAIISQTDVTKHFLIATDAGIFLTKDDGTTWEEANNGFARVATLMLRLRRSDNRVLAVTHGRGLFLATLDSAAVFGTTGISSENFSQQLQLNVYPNPVNDHLTISYNLSSPSNVQLKFFSMDGKLVEGFDLGELGSGSQKSELNTEGLSSGMYFIRFEAQSERKRFTDTKRIVVMR